MKKVRWIVWTISLLFCINLVATPSKGFSEYALKDISSRDWFYNDVLLLMSKGIINGYTDGNFRPSDSVSVAEFLKMSLIAKNEELVNSSDSTWYGTYVETAILKDYIDEEYYEDYLRPISRGEMAVIIDKMLDLYYVRSDIYKGNIIDYALVPNEQKESILDVYIAGILTGYEDRTIKTDLPVNRAEAATVIMRIINEQLRKPPKVCLTEEFDDESVPLGGVDFQEEQEVTKAFSIDGIETGMSLGYVLYMLGNPTEILDSQYGFQWYVYAEDYEKFKLIGIEDDRVVSLFSNVHVDSSLGIDVGSKEESVYKALSKSEDKSKDYITATYDDLYLTFYSQQKLDDGIEGIWISEDSFEQTVMTEDMQIASEKLVYYLMNGERFKNGVSLLSWSEEARNSSVNHSRDMAENAYFSHTDLQGRSSKERIQNEGIDGIYFGENIAAGGRSVIDFHYLLMHSEGHRQNILNEQFEYAGVGLNYLVTSKYGYYLTENFYKLKDTLTN